MISGQSVRDKLRIVAALTQATAIGEKKLHIIAVMIVDIVFFAAATVIFIPVRRPAKTK